MSRLMLWTMAAAAWAAPPAQAETPPFTVTPARLGNLFTVKETMPLVVIGQVGDRVAVRIKNLYGNSYEFACPVKADGDTHLEITRTALVKGLSGRNDSRLHEALAALDTYSSTYKTGLGDAHPGISGLYLEDRHMQAMSAPTRPRAELA